MGIWVAARRSAPALTLALGLFLPAGSRAQTSPGGEDVFFYLLCNATGWTANEATRLRPTADRNAFELSYQVTEPWMLSAGDTCKVLETKVEGGWNTEARFYGADHPVTLGIDERARLVPRFDAATAGFEVRYARTGLHHARFYRSEHTLSLREDGPPVEGRELWSIRGRLTLDADGRLFRVRYLLEPSEPAPSLARVSREDGRDLWSVSGSDFSLDPACVYADQLVVRTSEGLRAIDPESGRTIWSTQLGGTDPSNSSLVLTCPRSGSVLPVIRQGERQVLTVLSRATGATRWTVPLEDPFARVIVTTPDTIVTLAYVQSAARLRAFDVEQGVELWALSSASPSTVLTSPTEDLFLSTSYEVRRIDPRTGADHFRVASTAAYPSLTLEAGGTYLQEPERVMKLDNATGQTLWSRDLHASPDAYASSAVLPSGRVFISQRQGMESTELTLLDEASGQALWSQRFAATLLWPEEDRDGRLYARGERTLARLDPSDGRVLWEYRHAPEPAYYYAVGRLGPIADSDASRIYIAYYAPVPRYAPMSLISLDVATGERRFQFDDAGEIRVLGQDDQRLFIQTGYEETVARALLKHP